MKGITGISSETRTPDTKGPYAVTCRVCRQISPDDWETRTQILKVNPETTIEEIFQWWISNNPLAKKLDSPLEISKMEEG